MRSVGLLVAFVGLVLGLTSCTANPADQLRHDLAASLESQSPASARMVSDQATDLTVEPTAWLPNWRVICVLNAAGPHPRRFYAAFLDKTVSEVLTGQPDAFNRVVADGDVRLADATQAIDVGHVYLDSTRSSPKYTGRVESADDIGWLKNLTPEQEKVRRAAAAAIVDRDPERTADGWKVRLWMIDGFQLVRHDLAITTGGSVTDAPEVVLDNLPVPDSR